jgi:hypothetical protein
MEMLYRANLNPNWRRLIGLPEPDVHAKDVEFLLRAMAMLVDGEQYKESMNRFLNNFARRCQRLEEGRLVYFERLLSSFFNTSKFLPGDAFHGKGSRRFNISLFDAVFRATCTNLVDRSALVEAPLDLRKLNELKNDEEFVQATQGRTANAENVRKRIRRATAILSA